MTNFADDAPSDPLENGRPDPAHEGEIRTTVVLRPPTPLDLPAMADLWMKMQEEFQEEEPRYPGPPGPEPREAYLRRLEGWFQEPAFMLVGVRSPLRPPSSDPSPLVLAGSSVFGDAPFPAPQDVVAYIVMRAVPSAAASGDPDGSPPPRLGRLEALYVTPTLRCNGLARRMLEAGLGWLRSQQIRDVDAEILVRNRTGMIFLSRVGFELFRSVLRLSLADGAPETGETPGRS